MRGKRVKILKREFEAMAGKKPNPTLYKENMDEAHMNVIGWDRTKSEIRKMKRAWYVFTREGIII